MINIDLNISTVQLINIASTLIIGKIKDHRMIILESSMINVDIFSKILGICHVGFLTSGTDKSTVMSPNR